MPILWLLYVAWCCAQAWDVCHDDGRDTPHTHNCPRVYHHGCSRCWLPRWWGWQLWCNWCCWIVSVDARCQVWRQQLFLLRKLSIREHIYVQNLLNWITSILQESMQVNLVCYFLARGFKNICIRPTATIGNFNSLRKTFGQDFGTVWLKSTSIIHWITFRFCSNSHFEILHQNSYVPKSEH